MNDAVYGGSRGLPEHRNMVVNNEGVQELRSPNLLSVGPRKPASLATMQTGPNGRFFKSVGASWVVIGMGPRQETYWVGVGIFYTSDLQTAPFLATY